MAIAKYCQSLCIILLHCRRCDAYRTTALVTKKMMDHEKQLLTDWSDFLVLQEGGLQEVQNLLQRVVSA